MFFLLELRWRRCPSSARAPGGAERLLPGRGDRRAPEPGAALPAGVRRRPGRIGLRVPPSRWLAPLAEADWPVLQSSANPSGGPRRRAARGCGSPDPGGRRPGPGRRRAARHGFDGRGPGGYEPRICGSARSLPTARPRRAFSGILDSEMSELPPDYFTRPVAEVDPEVAEVMEAELRPPGDDARDDRVRELRPAGGARRPGLGADQQVRRGLPGPPLLRRLRARGRVEELAIERARELFGAEHVNVQPHAGAQANAAVYHALSSRATRCSG